jgi:hypothetical protein
MVGYRKEQNISVRKVRVQEGMEEFRRDEKQ